MALAPYHEWACSSPDPHEAGLTGGSYQGEWAGYESQTLTEWLPQAFSKRIDPDTGYWYYENQTTGERHWDRPLAGVAPLQLQPPRPENQEADAGREKRKLSEKETRRNDMVKRNAHFHKQVQVEAESDGSKEHRRVEGLWGEAEHHAARKGGIFSLAWQEVPGVSETHIFGFHERHGTRLIALHLVGLQLTEVPGAIGQHLWSLKTLSFSSNMLQEIPNGVCDLTGLTDLNLVRNRLVTLPDRFGNLLRLRELSVAGNRLEMIPPSFGNFIRLDRVVLDGNRLRRLPETLGRMKCRFLNVSNNRLGCLPHCVKDMPRLEVLSAVNNGLRSLPSDIGDSRSIKALHLASNRINQLPDSICSLKTLKVLWLDHNFIAGLPAKFHELEGLEKLYLEKNDMVYPPVDVVQEGCDRVRKWCARRMHDRIMARQHTIVMAVQDILQQVTNRGLGDPSFFEPDVQVGDKKEDRFFALVYERFWDTILPALETEWASGGLAPRGAVTSFNYSRDEVDAVLLKYRDPSGRVLRTKRQMFRRCSCVGENRRRRVCVPPKVGWMCERKATLIKHDIILEREQEERRRQDLERQDIEFRVILARRLVKDNSETIEDKNTYKRKAIRMAEELKRKQQLGAYESEADAMKAHRRTMAEKKFSKAKQALAKDREHRLADLKLKAAAMEEELKLLRGWGKEQKEAQLDQVLKSMEVLPEDAKMAEVNEQLEAELQKMEAKGAAVAAEKKRRITNKKVKRGDKEFQDLVDEMIADLVQQDMDAAGDAARKKAEEEHQVFRKIVAMWVGVGMRESFFEWKTWTKRRIRQRRKDARKALREAWHQFEADGVVGVMAEWKMSFWEERYDVYADNRHWVHKDTGEVRLECPTAQYFIPEGYKIPEPPTRRLEDMSSSDSDGSSRGGSDGDDSDEAANKAAADSSKSGSSSSGWSMASSSNVLDSVEDSTGPSAARGGNASSALTGDSEAHAATGSGEGSDGTSSTGGEPDSENVTSNDESISQSGSETGSSSSGSESGSGSGSDSHGSDSNDDHESNGVDDSSRSSSPHETLLLSDENAAASRGTTSERSGKRATTGDKTHGATRGETSEALVSSLVIHNDGSMPSTEELGGRALAISEGGGARLDDTAISTPIGGRSGRKASTSVREKRRQRRPKTENLAEFIKEKAGQVNEAATALLQASDDPSSSASSLRTAKTLERQTQWEVHHARARAQQLRAKAVQEFQQELKVRRKMAGIETMSQESSSTPAPSVDKVMEVVGWDENEEYTREQLDTFAAEAMKKMTELGKDGDGELAQYGSKYS